MGRLRFGSLLGSVIAGMVILPAADGAIVVHRGVAGVNLQMTRTDVRAVLGSPAATRTDRHPVTGTMAVHTYRGLVVRFASGRVVSIVSTRPAERTRRGVGVGSTEGIVRARIGGIRCETVASVRSCSTGTFRPGTAVTTFDLRGPAVWRVRIGRVID